MCEELTDDDWPKLKYSAKVNLSLSLLQTETKASIVNFSQGKLESNQWKKQLVQEISEVDPEPLFGRLSDSQVWADPKRFVG